nr:unnamed protein product [Callosobruchus chinensis]
MEKITVDLKDNNWINPKQMVIDRQKSPHKAPANSKETYEILPPLNPPRFTEEIPPDPFYGVPSEFGKTIHASYIPHDIVDMCEHNAWQLHRMQGGTLDHLSFRKSRGAEIEKKINIKKKQNLTSCKMVPEEKKIDLAPEKGLKLLIKR